MTRSLGIRVPGEEGGEGPGGQGGERERTGGFLGGVGTRASRAGTLLSVGWRRAANVRTNERRRESRHLSGSAPKPLRQSGLRPPRPPGYAGRRQTQAHGGSGRFARRYPR